MSGHVTLHPLNGKKNVAPVVLKSESHGDDQTPPPQKKRRLLTKTPRKEVKFEPNGRVDEGHGRRRHKIWGHSQIRLFFNTSPRIKRE